MGHHISPASLSHIPKKSLGAVCCILSATLFGTMPLLAKIAYEHGSNAYTAAFGRYLFGSIMLFAILSIKPGSGVRVTRRQLLQAFGLSIFFALTSILLYASYDLISSGLATTLFQKGVLLGGELQASLLSTFEPLTGVLLGLLLFNELLTGKIAAGIFCILLATVVLVLPKNKNIIWRK